MKKVVLYGAYDRYNFGDNLMPIVFELYVKKHYPELMDKIEFIYASVSDSDLGNYACLQTQSINTVASQLGKGDSIVVVGGEVLCASAFTLFTHMPKNKTFNDLLVFVNRVPYVRFMLHKAAHFFYHAPWSYPYIPNKQCVSDGVKVLYNTVGGSVSWLTHKHYKDVSLRLNSADFISVRDKRTEKELDYLEQKVECSPDSVYIISSLCDDAFIERNITDKVAGKYDFNYVVFQAAPTKVGESFDDVLSSLKRVSQENNVKIVLLPIGYAAGHDDYYYLKQIHREIPEHTKLAYELNIWDILYVIKNSKAYIGTSLHGAIVAMSYAVPHFGLNAKVKKLDAFLSDWSIAPFNRCYQINKIPSLISEINDSQLANLSRKRDENELLVNNNFDNMVELIML